MYHGNCHCKEKHGVARLGEVESILLGIIHAMDARPFEFAPSLENN